MVILSDSHNLLGQPLSFLLGGCISDKKKVLSEKDEEAAILAEEGQSDKRSNEGYVTASRINLLYVKAYQTKSGTTTYSYVEGYVEVEKPSYDRTVTIHYANNGDLTKWYDDTTSCKYYAESPNGAPGTREILYFKKQITNKIRFAVKWSRPGLQDYWDNNGGLDYTVGVGTYDQSMILGLNNIAMEKFVTTKNTVKYQKVITGSVLLKNLAYTKDVKIVYSTDGWKTSKSAVVNYGEKYYAFERWNFSAYLDYTVTNAKFKFVYVVNGQTYVDDNCGKYYTAAW